MQIKSILLLLVIGAVAVLAKKGSSEERDGWGSQILDVWPYPRPAHGPKPFKFKHPKHHVQVPVYVIGRPGLSYESQQPSFGGQQPFFESQQPSFAPQQQLETVASDVQKYLQNLMKEMQDVSIRAYTAFQKVEAELDRTRGEVENHLKKKFQNLQLTVERKLERAMALGKEQGKDQEKLKSCVDEKQEEFEIEANDEIQRTSACITDATERARKILSDARNSFTEISVRNSMEAKAWAQEMKICVARGDYSCIQQKMLLINQKAQDTVEEGMKLIQKIEEAPRQQMIQLDYCRQNFLQDLREMRFNYGNIARQCIDSVEGSTPAGETEISNEKPLSVPLPVPIPATSESESESDSESDEAKIQLVAEAKKE